MVSVFYVSSILNAACFGDGFAYGVWWFLNFKNFNTVMLSGVHRYVKKGKSCIVCLPGLHGCLLGHG